MGRSGSLSVTVRCRSTKEHPSQSRVITSLGDQENQWAISSAALADYSGGTVADFHGLLYSKNPLARIQRASPEPAELSKESVSRAPSSVNRSGFSVAPQP